MKFDQATGLCGGVEVPSSCRPPSLDEAAEVAACARDSARSTRAGSRDPGRRCRARRCAGAPRPPASRGEAVERARAGVGSRDGTTRASRSPPERRIDRPARQLIDRVTSSAARRLRAPAWRGAALGAREQRPALHVARAPHAEEIEHRRRDVEQRRLGRRRSCGCSRRRPGTSRGSTQWSPDQDLVLSREDLARAPRPSRSPTSGGSPCGSRSGAREPCRRRGRRGCSRVTNASLITRLAVERVAQRLELRLELAAQRRRAPALARRCPCASRPLRLMKTPVKPEREGLGLRPIDVREPVAARSRAFLEDQVALLAAARCSGSRRGGSS